jgi:hypothetical protein
VSRAEAIRETRGATPKELAEAGREEEKTQTRSRTTTAAAPTKQQHLSDAEWKELEGKTAATLIVFLGDKAPAGEEGRVAFLHSEEEALSETSCREPDFKAHAPCFLQVGQLLAQAAAEARGQAAAMAEHAQGPCAGALRTDADIWAGLERVAQRFEHEDGSGEGQDEWQRAAAPAEHLVVFAREVPGEEPRRTELGAGLEACRPPGNEESE